MPRNCLPQTWLACLLLALSSIAVSPTAAQAKMSLPVSAVSSVNQSTTIVVGKVISSDWKNNRAVVEVLQTLRGKPFIHLLTVSPIDSGNHEDLGLRHQIDDVNIYMGTMGADNTLRLAQSGRSCMGTTPESRDSVIAAAKKLIELDTIQDPQKKTFAVLSLSKTDNPALQHEAVTYQFLYAPVDQKNVEVYIPLIQELLDHPSATAQQMGLMMLWRVKVPRFVPRLIELTQSPDTRVAGDACACLRDYDTPETRNVIIRMTQHPNPELRARALGCLGLSKTSQAQDAVLKAMDDPQPGVRLEAVRTTSGWFHWGVAAPVMPKVISLLSDSDESVRATAAHSLGSGRLPEATKALIAFYKKQAPDTDAEYAGLTALNTQFAIHDSPQANALIQADTPAFIAILKRNTTPPRILSHFPAIQLLKAIRTPDAVAALQWAAESHPSPSIREHAKEALASIPQQIK